MSYTQNEKNIINLIDIIDKGYVFKPEMNY